MKELCLKYRWVGSALFECGINLGVSLLPFAVAVIALMLSKTTNKDLGDAFSTVTGKGELIVYSATLMAPIMYAVLRNPPVSFKAAFGIFGAIPVVLGVVVYTIANIDGFSDRLNIFSYGCFALAVIVFFLLLLVEHEFESKKSAPQIQADSRAISLSEYQKHRETK
ncbi:hypothetical protein [uncultured Pseudomonas sp.]|uniref:hypothetical protein n=1 Tax=uncultured Pseudomonas sp. TaxID=114707 RepID=UPI0025DEC7E5|nr:hypothetical protein [uncultured Pseudomonas sp.]